MADPITVCIAMLEYMFTLNHLTPAQQQLQFASEKAQKTKRPAIKPVETFKAVLERRYQKALREGNDAPGTIFADFEATPLEDVVLGIETERQLLTRYCPTATELLVVSNTRHHRRFLECGDTVLAAGTHLAPTQDVFESLLDGSVGGSIALVTLRILEWTADAGEANTEIDNAKFKLCYDNTTAQKDEEAVRVLQVTYARPEDKLCIGDLVYFKGAPVVEEGPFRGSFKSALNRNGMVTVEVKRRVVFSVQKLAISGAINVKFGDASDLDAGGRKSSSRKKNLVVLRTTNPQLERGDTLLSIDDPRQYPPYGWPDPKLLRERAVYDLNAMQEILDVSIGTVLKFEVEQEQEGDRDKTVTVINTAEVTVMERLLVRDREISQLVDVLWQQYQEHDEVQEHLRFSAIRALSQKDVLLFLGVFLFCTLVGFGTAATTFLLMFPFIYMLPTIAQWYRVAATDTTLTYAGYGLFFAWIMSYVSWLWWMGYYGLVGFIVHRIYVHFLRPYPRAMTTPEPAMVQPPEIAKS